MTSDEVFKSQLLYRSLHIQNIYHRAKFECSSFSSLANTRGGLKGPPLLKVTKKPGWNRVKPGWTLILFYIPTGIAEVNRNFYPDRLLHRILLTDCYPSPRLARILVVPPMTFTMAQQRNRTIYNPKLIAIFVRLEKILRANQIARTRRTRL